ncbi:MAG: polymer-forming cytoskeletal protein [Rhodobacteraceae bacterium]|nr:polymer-forming cytoskeletal protein [Paracoccaceae bacterium]
MFDRKPAGAVPSTTPPSPTDRRRSVLHDGITIEGNWSSDGIVEFGGKIVGDLTVETLVLTKDGQVVGNVHARNVTIEGILTGSIEADSVSLLSTASVEADIVTQDLSIAHGASINGALKVIGR